jgi:hypothetical protein
MNKNAFFYLLFDGKTNISNYKGAAIYPAGMSLNKI